MLGAHRYLEARVFPSGPLRKAPPGPKGSWRRIKQGQSLDRALTVLVDGPPARVPKRFADKAREVLEVLKDHGVFVYCTQLEVPMHDVAPVLDLLGSSTTGLVVVEVKVGATAGSGALATGKTWRTANVRDTWRNRQFAQLELQCRAVRAHTGRPARGLLLCVQTDGEIRVLSPSRAFLSAVQEEHALGAERVVAAQQH